MSNYFSNYVKRVHSEKCENNQKDDLINQSAGKTKIYHRRRKLDIIVNLILSNKVEGLGTGKVLTWAKDDLQVGDYFLWNEKVFLVTDEDNNVYLDNYINKFIVRECNCIIKYNYQDSKHDEQDAVYIGRAAHRTGYNIETAEDTAKLDVNDDSVIIFSNTTLKSFDNIVINSTQWKITAWDDITCPKIVYTTCKRVPINQEPSSIPNIDQEYYYQGVTYTFPTEDYYFESNTIVEFTRNEKQITIKIPYGINDLSFSTKENGEIIVHNIKIGENNDF